MQRLSDYRPEVERVVSEGNELAQMSATARVATSAQQLQLKYITLFDDAKVNFQ